MSQSENQSPLLEAVIARLGAGSLEVDAQLGKVGYAIHSVLREREGASREATLSGGK